jgi:hypothetical protein
MGTWANDPFGNDAACDWKYDVEKCNDLRSGLNLIKATLEKTISAGNEYLEGPDADEGIAAADTVARLRGHFYDRNAYTKSLDEWVARQSGEIPQELVDLALRVVDRVLTPPSEALELWEETGEAEDWKMQLEELKERLHEPPVQS